LTASLRLKQSISCRSPRTIDLLERGSTPSRGVGDAQGRERATHMRALSLMMSVESRESVAMKKAQDRP
jgi:hypothetical protein